GTPSRVVPKPYTGWPRYVKCPWTNRHLPPCDHPACRVRWATKPLQCERWSRSWPLIPRGVTPKFGSEVRHSCTAQCDFPAVQARTRSGSCALRPWRRHSPLNVGRLVDRRSLNATWRPWGLGGLALMAPFASTYHWRPFVR